MFQKPESTVHHFGRFFWHCNLSKIWRTTEKHSLHLDVLHIWQSISSWLPLWLSLRVKSHWEEPQTTPKPNKTWFCWWVKTPVFKPSVCCLCINTGFLCVECEMYPRPQACTLTALLTLQHILLCLGSYWRTKPKLTSFSTKITTMYLCIWPPLGFSDHCACWKWWKLHR